MDINSNNEDKSALEKSLVKMKNKAANLRKVINSGDIEGSALRQASDEFNSISEKIEKLEAKIANYTQLNKYRILTYDYFKQLCHEGSKLLTHSSLAEKRAFVEKCIESVTLDPVRKAVNVKFNINVKEHMV